MLLTLGAIEWQGATGDITPGTTILDGIEQAVAAGTKVQYDRLAGFDRIKDASGQAGRPRGGAVVPVSVWGYMTK